MTRSARRKEEMPIPPHLSRASARFARRKEVKTCRVKDTEHVCSLRSQKDVTPPASHQVRSRFRLRVSGLQRKAPQNLWSARAPSLRSGRSQRDPTGDRSNPWHKIIASPRERSQRTLVRSSYRLRSIWTKDDDDPSTSDASELRTIPDG